MEMLDLHAYCLPIDHNTDTDFMATYLHNLRRMPGPAPKPKTINVVASIYRPEQPTEFNFRIARNGKHCAEISDVEDALCSFYLKNETLSSITARLPYQKPAIYKWMRGDTNVARDLMRKNNIVAFSGLLKNNITFAELSK